MEVPLICPLMGVSSNIIHDAMAQVKLAMKDLSTLGQLVFPSMDTSSKAFVAYLEVMSTVNGFKPVQAKASSWIRPCFWNTCLDILALDKEDDPCDLWLEALKDRRDKTLELFSQVMLFRESFNTHLR